VQRTQNSYLAISLLIVALLVITDQVVKGLIISKFPWAVTVNTGGSFGMLSDLEFYRYASLALTVFVFIYFVKSKESDKPLIALMLSGALSNTLDRFTRGAVVDYINLPYWPTFNLADVLIFVSVVLIIYKTAGAPKLKS